MKRLITILTICALFLTSSIYSQETAPPVTRHSAFASYGMSWTPNSDLTYSGEVGTWGTKSPTSFSLTFDATRSTYHSSEKGANVFTKWGGVKAYYTIYERSKICYMLYAKEAIQLDNTQNTLLEFGFNPNYTLSDHFLLGVTVGNQAIKDNPWNLFSSVGIVYLLQP